MASVYRQLCLEERVVLQTQLSLGLSPAQIASTLARMPTPVRISHETFYASRRLDHKSSSTLYSTKVIDLLPDRESGTVAAWLRQHLARRA
jgi:IS30 family transposase